MRVRAREKRPPSMESGGLVSLSHGPHSTLKRGGYPDPLPKDEVAARAGYDAAGGGFNNAISRLRTLELISGRGELRASEHLF